MISLGISAFYHDSAAALVRDGHIVAAAQEERFTRIKGDASFPAASIAYCLDEAGISLDEVDHVAFYEKPILTFDRLLETYLAYAPAGFTSFAKSIPLWIKEKILQQSLLTKGLRKLGRGTVSDKKLVFGFHHHSHAASAFYPSPFEEAAILVMDGVGEWATTTIGQGRGNNIELLNEIRFPHSLGMLYSAFTYYLGFKVNEGEYKVMGLAPYGEPRFTDKIKGNLIDLRSDGSFRLNMEYFNYCTGLTMTNARFDALFGAPPRHPAARLSQRDMDIARSIQAVTEEAILNLARAAHQQTGLENLCLAGGVALNCVANGRVLREGPFKRIWIQPASGDAGGAVGAALAVAHSLGNTARKPEPTDLMQGALLGPAYDDQRIEEDLRRQGAKYRRVSDSELFDTVTAALADEQVVGWFQGRLEYGPRSLGNRSILGDPRSPRMQRVLNLKIKYRESFRPFAPAVLRDHVNSYFELDGDSPYMLLVASVRPERRVGQAAGADLEGIDRLRIARSDIPAVTHVDYSARIQTVDSATNPRFHSLLESFYQRTGCPVLVNTSFNVRDEPIVCTPDDAFRCFMGTEMDVLAIGNFILRKSEQ